MTIDQLQREARALRDRAHSETFENLTLTGGADERLVVVVARIVRAMDKAELRGSGSTLAKQIAEFFPC